MDVLEFISTLRSRGVRIWAEDGRIRASARKEQLLRSDIEIIRSLKPRILQILETQQTMEDIPLEPRSAGQSVVRLTANQYKPWYYSTSIGSRQMMISIGLRLRGLVDVERLKASLQKLQLRHEPLRATIEVHNGVLAQRIESDAVSDFVVEQLKGTDSDDGDAIMSRVGEIAEERLARPGCVFGGSIVRVNETFHILVIFVDHIVTDGFSNEIILGELWSIYSAECEGRVADLPSLRVQFPDYADWLWRVYPTWKRIHEPYWTNRLNNTQAGPLVVKRPATTHNERSFSSLELKVNAGVVTKMWDVCRSLKTRPVVIVLAAYSAALSRWMSQVTLPITVVDSGRHRAELVPIIGCLAELLHVRIDVNSRLTFSDLFDRVYSEYTAVCEHRDFGWLPEAKVESDFFFNFVTGGSGIGSMTSINPSSFSVEPFALPAPKQRPELNRVLPFKLALGAFLSPQTLSMSLSYEEGIWDPETLKAFRNDFLLLLDVAVGNPNIRLQSLAPTLRSQEVMPPPSAAHG